MQKRRALVSGIAAFRGDSQTVSYAVRKGMRPDNPVSGVEKHAYAERQRRATEAEYASLGEAMRDMPRMTRHLALAAAKFLR